MFSDLERGERASIQEASAILVDPFKKVVTVAMQRLSNEGTIDIDNPNRQTVTLLDDDTKREYKIINCPVGKLGGVVISTGDLVAGLFIEAVRLKIAENQDKWIFSIQLPRNPDLVNKVSLESLRGFNPKEVNKLVDSLRRSTRKL